MGKRKTAIAGQLTDLDLRLLRVFKTVAEAGGITAAETELNLANSTLSNYIADLEKRLDMRLCERGRTGFSLTHHGQEVYAATLELLGAVDQFKQQVNTSHGKILGDLHLGCAEHMMGVHSEFIVSCLREYTERAPDVQLKISTMVADAVITSVLEGQVHIGITVFGEDKHPRLQTLRLHDEELSLYCGNEHPLFDRQDQAINTDELGQYKYVASPCFLPGNELYPFMRQWDSSTQAFHQEARAQLILTGKYLGFLPPQLVETWGLQQRLRAIKPTLFNYNVTYYAFAKASTLKSLSVSQFMDVLRQLVPEASHTKIPTPG
uniref:LysR family transcriptional regulator n=1 Tax=uncultured Thiotrichaceae bacterium TaxID=298394 RepID=A0A6S6TS64_9GAMM|nr:MAG: LysR family transcriptional regulator [uncultured Thiotrichaceae bacterium]